MHKALKITLWLLAGILTLVLTAIIATVVLVRPDFIKKQINKWVQENTDRQVNINGDMHWSFTHGLGLTVNDVSLSSPQSFGNTPFAHAKTMTITLQIAPLFKKEFAVNHLRFNGLDLNLVNKPSDINNWTIQFKQPQPAKSDNDFKMLLSEITLKNSTIAYVNERTHQKIKLNNVNFNADGIRTDAPVYLSGSAKLAGIRPSFDGNLSIHGKVSYHPNKNQLQLQNFEVVSSHPTKILSAFTVFASGDIDTNSGSFSLPKLELNFANEVKAQGYLVRGYSHGHEQISGKLKTNTFNAKNLLNNLGYPIKTNNKNALQAVTLESEIHVKGTRINLDKLNAQIDALKLSGLASINTTDHSINVDLNGGRLNLDDYQLIPAQNHLAKAATKISNSTSKKPTSKMTLDGKLRLNQVQTDGIVLNNVITQFNFVNDTLKLNNFTASVFDGSTQGSAMINFSGKTPSYQLQQNLANVDLGVMLKTLLNATPLSGRANVNLNISATGTQAKQVQKSLNGKVSLSARSGIIYGIDIDHQVAKVVAHMTKDMVELRNTQQSAYEQINAELTINDGVINNPSLSIQLPRFHIKGKGALNLINERINYSLAMKPLNKLHVKTPIGNTDLSQYYIPMTISGTLQDPKPNLDYPAIVALTIKKQATDVIKNTLQNEIETKVFDAIKNKLPF